MIPKPHGGRLINLVTDEKKQRSNLDQMNGIPCLKINSSIAMDLENLAYGVYSPLSGFMSSEELNSVLKDGRLPNDLPWTIPVVLDVPEDRRNEFDEGDRIILSNNNHSPLAVMNLEEIHKYNKAEYAEKVFRTRDNAHPGVRRVFESGEILLAGKIQLIGEVSNEYQNYTLWPAETRDLFNRKGWETVCGFQTRNAPHISHEYLQKTALSFVDGIFINPVIGKKKSGDFRDDVILAAYDTLLKLYYPKDTAVMSILKYEMRYAGPREAIFHAIVRKNFGCSHIIIGRDHAGVGQYYKPFEAQEIFNEYPDLGIEPFFFREFFYCLKCCGVVNERICPHQRESRVSFSGTELRNMLLKGQRPPPEFMRPEITDIIMKWKNPFVD